MKRVFLALIFLISTQFNLQPVHAATSTINYAFANIAQASTTSLASISLELTSPDRAQSWSVRILRTPKVFNSRSELLAFEKNPLIASQVVLAKSGTADLEKINPFRVRIEIPDAPQKSLEIRGYLAEISTIGGKPAKVPFFLIGKGNEGVEPTPISWIWPILDTPHRNIEGVFTDDLLATSLLPQGRLGRMLTAAEGRNFTWYIDAELIESVEAMSKGYSLLDGSDGVGKNAAIEWLARLRGAIVGRDVYAAPYGDPDLATFISLKKSSALAALQVIGANRLAQSLGVSVQSDLAWPSRGIFSTKSLAYLKSAGYTKCIVSRRMSPAPTNETATRTSFANAGGVNLFIGDEILSGYLKNISTEKSNHFYAQLAMITAERPTTARPQVLIPERMPTLTYSQALVADRELPINEISPVIPATTTPLSALTDLKVSRLEPRSTSVLPRVESLIAQFGAVTLPPYVSTTESKLRSTLILGAAWRSAPFAGYLFSQSTLKIAERINQQARVLPGRYTLTDLSGKVPLTLRNDAAIPVNLRLELRPTTLRLKQPEVIDIQLPAKSHSQVSVPITAYSSGQVFVEARLLDASDQQVGDVVLLQISISSIPPAAILVTEIAGAALLLAAAAQIIRRVRRRRS
ncbi:MAG: hypothetical protein F2718_02145 [Actinobacteria bacterium]|uniref:Unannotated protein n=1 Tax=freshwater metagenome TaxID=449393 RepID=A0A6J7F914_9ZZZZ|nr:hypothetical protein [Actinomycetota bacterium]MSY26703.1 hypothetical protein [Actinomycetota bacterium]MSZ86450.1 hypothetical protein [Actinomycetota bacterium]MTB14354.1 hypothetical protein [Actinomycetota bacterium]MTB24835.1 hypothetical protein [Actinomycetota bacterium]